MTFLNPKGLLSCLQVHSSIKSRVTGCTNCGPIVGATCGFFLCKANPKLAFMGFQTAVWTLQSSQSLPPLHIEVPKLTFAAIHAKDP